MKNLSSFKNSLFSRRRMLQGAAASVAAANLPFAAAAAPESDDLPPAFSDLKPLGSRVQPITSEEFQHRMQHAQELMSSSKPKFDALFVGPGTSLYYFTSIHWGNSERLLALLLPNSGKPFLVCPAFEEGRLREHLRFPIDIRVWQEDESPTGLAVATLRDLGIRTGRIGIEETARFTFFDHLRSAANGFECISADPITIGCRARKSEAELQLMRLACEATCDVYRAMFASLKEGMSQDSVSSMIERGYAKMHLRGDAMVLFGESAALPHGSSQPRTLREGDVVLIDDGCNVEGYGSDITRTGIYGKPSEKIAHAYELVRNAQDAALEAARAGRLSGTVDDAARAVIVNGGFGPGYKFFSHRLGHGIGLDGHEHPYLVRGSKTVLESNMTFSNEPGIYIPGEFGIRCEDDMVITANGPAQLLTPRFQVSMEKPVG